MVNYDGERDVVFMFSDEELSEISGVKRGCDYIEVTCGCTSHRYGDAVGRLRVFIGGDLEISCECAPGCQEDLLLRNILGERLPGNGRAMSGTWVIVKGEKVPLSKTVLLKYHNQASKSANGSHRSHNGRSCHRDEFVHCTTCNMERRFRLRTKEECRIHAP